VFSATALTAAPTLRQAAAQLGKTAATFIPV
jgi:hypothetical protein